MKVIVSHEVIETVPAMSAHNVCQVFNFFLFLLTVDNIIFVNGPDNRAPLIINIPIIVCIKKNLGVKAIASLKTKATLKKSKAKPIQMTLLMVGKKGKMFCLRKRDFLDVR